MGLVMLLHLSPFFLFSITYITGVMGLYGVIFSPSGLRGSQQVTLSLLVSRFLS